MNLNNDKPICALATPPGHSAIGVIRLSGEGSLRVVSLCCPGLKTAELKSHSAKLTKILNEDGSAIDQALVLYFQKGKSYTGEESVEISCHGSPYICQKIISRLVACGARIATPGEFTFRAFMNGKIDLVQAEGVLTLIESDSDSSLKIGHRQIEGETSKSFQKLTSDLTWSLAHIEASIDFSTEGLETATKNQLLEKLESVLSGLVKLTETYASGRILKDGLHVALLGRPNSGKSSLLNNFLQMDRAIVSPIAGTTRDVVDGETIFKGIKIHFSDTAGVRDTSDSIEKIGIEKSMKAALESDVVFYICDATKGFDSEEIKLIESLRQKTKVFVIQNKQDLVLNGSSQPGGPDLIENQNVFVSALDPKTRDQVFSLVLGPLIESNKAVDSAVVASARQYELAVSAKESIESALSELRQDLGAEFVSQRLKAALVSLQKILGEHYDDQILDRVFKEFCLGK